MVDTEDWRRRRALELGLGPFDISAAKHDTDASDVGALPPAANNKGASAPDDGVEEMRYPLSVRAPVESTDDDHRLSSHDLELPRDPVAFDRRAASRDESVRAPTPVPRPPLEQLNGIRSWLTVAVVLAAAVYWYFARQAGPPPAPAPAAAVRPVPAALVDAKRSLDLAADDIPQESQQVVEPAPCTGAAIVDALHTLVSDQVRQRTGLDGSRPALRVAVALTDSRAKVAAPRSAVVVCTALLSLRRPARKVVAFDIDYVVRSIPGLPDQITPLGLDKRLDAVVADDLKVQEPAPVLRPGRVADSPPAVTTPTRVAATPPSKFVIVPQTRTPSVFQAEPASINLPSTLSLSTGAPDGIPAPARSVRGCDRPATATVRITCSNPSLLALNVAVGADLVALDREENRDELARIKRGADRRFDRCTNASCVEKAYHRWLDDLAQLRRQDPGEIVSSGQEPRR